MHKYKLFADCYLEVDPLIDVRLETITL